MYLLFAFLLVGLAYSLRNKKVKFPVLNTDVKTSKARKS